MREKSFVLIFLRTERWYLNDDLIELDITFFFFSPECWWACSIIFHLSVFFRRNRRVLIPSSFACFFPESSFCSWRLEIHNDEPCWVHFYPSVIQWHQCGIYCQFLENFLEYLIGNSSLFFSILSLGISDYVPLLNLLDGNP